ncbi:glycerate dehydrogenase [Cordyceps militaris CM01]|uniref:Glycerate dehydrogenase n=1 Tax=Cordyceps militaris (strain CM01) TaxID=983644 RepID=G3JIY9_CORMM|nr:glycerate dehydrogenase [Cordyceps militaris CM01]EGX91983.1 glycerate dehydrogenase [Cordyceps militaris CM01]
MHHKIVALDAWNVPIPESLLQLPAPHTYELACQTSQLSSTEAIQEAVRDATIIATTVTPLKGSTLDVRNTPSLELIVAIATGTDCIDVELAAARGIKVVNCPNANTETVANHVLAMYFAGRRHLMQLHNTVLRTDEWPKKYSLRSILNDPEGNPPRTCTDETVGVVGYGAIGERRLSFGDSFSILFFANRDGKGRRIAELCRSLGMKVLIAARKGASASADRVPFTQVLAQSSVVVLCVPRGPDTLHLISAPELHAMPRHALLLNVSRGGIVDEEALLAALRAGTIGGAATDVFLQEPSAAGPFWKEGDSSPLLRVDAAEADRLNLVVTPHVAWCSTTTFSNYLQAFKRHVEEWCAKDERRESAIN